MQSNSNLIDELAHRASDDILGVWVLDQRKFARLIIEQVTQKLEGSGQTQTADEIRSLFGITL